MYICDNCGATTKDYGTHSSYLCEVGETSVYETCDDQCSCGGNWVKAKECAICGEYIPEYEFDVCQKCLDKNKTIEGAFQAGQYDCEKIYVSGFLAQLYNEDEINKILREHFTREVAVHPEKYNLVKSYCDEHEADLAQWLAERE